MNIFDWQTVKLLEPNGVVCKSYMKIMQNAMAVIRTVQNTYKQMHLQILF